MTSPYHQRGTDPRVEAIKQRLVTDVDADFCKKHGIKFENDEIDSRTLEIYSKEACAQASAAMQTIGPVEYH